MRLRKWLVAAAALAAVAGAGGVARGQEVVATPAPPPAQQPFWRGAPPSDSVERRLDVQTALTLGAGKLKLGILALSYNFTDWLEVGIDPPYWALKAFGSVLVPNGHLKLVALRRSGLWIAGNVAAYYASLTKDDNAKGNLLVIPLSFFGSVRPVDKLWLHSEVTYVFANLDGTGDYKRLTIGGTAASSALQLGLIAQYEVLHWLSITLMGRYQPYTQTVSLSGSGPVGDGGTVTVEGRVEPPLLHPWQVVPGVAFLWKYVRLTLGAGYGTYFLPGMDVPVRAAGFVPGASLYVVL